MSKKHKYKPSVKWTGNKGTGTSNYKSYDRSHVISIENKPDILCSSDPVFQGDRTKYNPEELFVASVSACHMLWFLHLCSNAGIIVVEYIDNAIGEMEETGDGGGHFTSITLYPRVKVSKESMIEGTLILHENAHNLCFLANSCNFPVSVKPSCSHFET